MNRLQPIYTEARECQDCYKCLRQCRVKAIDIQDGHASVIANMCILCGNCVQVCPMGAKKVRSDIERVKLLFRMKKHVYASVAPSYLAEFEPVDSSQFIAALKDLGFEGVSETAIGAEQISAAVAARMEKKASVSISSACPSVVELIKRYHPEYEKYVCNMLSPVLAHCKVLRETYGNDIGVVFIGPCIAKKREADENPYLLDVAITYHELRAWFDEEGIDPSVYAPDGGDTFVPNEAHEGRLYPIDGGMIAGIKADSGLTDGQFMSFSGIGAIQRALENLEDLTDRGPLFLELLACEGGCVNGPMMHQRSGTIVKRSSVIRSFQGPRTVRADVPCVDVDHAWNIEPVAAPIYTEDQIAEALKRAGKFGKEDELNCGGCGYDSCRSFAKALLDGRAEETMCMGYMRQLAQKQADALLRAMPSGVVIVDESLQIVESNRRFSQILGKDIERVYEAKPHLEGARLEKIVPFWRLFEQVVHGGTAHLEKDVKIGSRTLHVTVFTIEKHRRVGGIVQDITEPWVRKEQIINKARKVIAQNLETVQQIAYLLGENAAESEVILNSIVEMYEPEQIRDNINENE